MAPQDKRKLVWQGTKSLNLLKKHADESAEIAENTIETLITHIHVYEETKPKYLLIVKAKFKPSSTTQSCKARREITKQDIVEFLDTACEPLQSRQKDQTCPTREEFIEWMLNQFLITQEREAFSLNFGTRPQLQQAATQKNQQRKVTTIKHSAPRSAHLADQVEEQEEHSDQGAVDEDDLPMYEHVCANRSIETRPSKPSVSIRSTCIPCHKSNEWSEDKHLLEMDIAVSRKQLSKLQLIEQCKQELLALQQKNQWKQLFQQRQVFQQKQQDCVAVRNKILDAVEFQQLVYQQQKKQQVALQRQWQQQTQINLRGIRRNSVKWQKGAVIGSGDRHLADDLFGLTLAPIGLTSDLVQESGIAYDLNGRKHRVVANSPKTDLLTPPDDVLTSALHKLRKWIDKTIQPPCLLRACQVFRQVDLTHKGWLRMDRFVHAMGSTCRHSDVLQQQTKLSTNQRSALLQQFGLVRTHKSSSSRDTKFHATSTKFAAGTKVSKEENSVTAMNDGWICYEMLFWHLFDAPAFCKRLVASRRPQLELTLQRFDVEHGGSISWQHFRQSLEQIHLVPSEEELQLLRIRFDPLRQDGKWIDYNKFLAFLDPSTWASHEGSKKATDRWASRLLQQLDQVATSQKQIHQLIKQRSLSARLTDR